MPWRERERERVRGPGVIYEPLHAFPTDPNWDFIRGNHMIN